MKKEFFKRNLETLREELMKINDMDHNLYIFSSNKTEKYILSLLGYIEKYFEFFENNNLGKDIKLKIDSNNLQKYSGSFVVAINNLLTEIEGLTDKQFKNKLKNNKENKNRRRTLNPIFWVQSLFIFVRDNYFKGLLAKWLGGIIIIMIFIIAIYIYLKF